MEREKENLKLLVYGDKSFFSSEQMQKLQLTYLLKSFLIKYIILLQCLVYFHTNMEREKYIQFPSVGGLINFKS